MPRSFLVKKHQSTKKPNYGRLDSNTDGVPSSIHENFLLPSHGPSPHHPPRQSPWLLQIPQLLSASSSSSSSSSSTPVFLRIDRQHLPHSLNTSPLPSSAPPVEADSITAAEAYKGTESCTALKQEVRRSNFLSSHDHGRRETLLPPSIPPSIPPSLHLLALVPSVPPGGCSQDKFECFDCQKAYFSFSGLAKHKQLHCGWQSKKYFSCKYCEKEYVSLGALKMHIRTHTLPCVCKLCGKAFSRPWLLQGHIRTHTGEKPFSCLHCSRAFADRSNLRAHLQTHSDVKKYQCASCSKTFSRISLLAKHQEAGCCPLS